MSGILILVPKLIGGLGNQLFILASTIDVAERIGATVFFKEKPGNPHCIDLSLADMFPQIKIQQSLIIESEISGGIFEYTDIVAQVPSGSKVIHISGYNQHSKYVPRNICDFMKNIPDIDIGFDTINTAFIHVRRGDYINHDIYDFDTKTYYRAAVSHLSNNNKHRDIKLVIFSDDTTWANIHIPEMLCDIISPKNIIRLNTKLTATQTLKLMSKCEAGAICVNSTLGWWGAYSNKNRPIYMPHPWSKYDISENLGLYFDGVIKISSTSGLPITTP